MIETIDGLSESSITQERHSSFLNARTKNSVVNDSVRRMTRFTLKCSQGCVLSSLPSGAADRCYCFRATIQSVLRSISLLHTDNASPGISRVGKSCFLRTGPNFELFDFREASLTQRQCPTTRIKTVGILWYFLTRLIACLTYSTSVLIHRIGSPLTTWKDTFRLSSRNSSDIVALTILPRSTTGMDIIHLILRRKTLFPNHS